MLDHRLTWFSQIELVSNRIRKLIWIFKNLRHISSKKLLNTIYLTLAQSVISYCIPAWGGAAKTRFLDLERAQRSLLKVMLFKNYMFPTTQLYSLSGLLSVRSLYILRTVLKTHKTLPHSIDSLRKRRKDIVAKTHPARTKFARNQFQRQSHYLYNLINKKLNINPLNVHACRKILVEYLSSLSYEDVENLLKRII